MSENCETYQKVALMMNAKICFISGAALLCVIWKFAQTEFLIHRESYAAGELKHGTISLITEISLIAVANSASV